MKPISIIDSHLHIGWANNRYYSPSQVIELIDRNKIKFSLISSLSGATVSQTFGNKETYNFVKNHPKIMRGLIWINPYDPDWQKDANFYIKKFCGIKLHPSLNRYYIRFDFLKPVFAFAEKNELAIFLHTSKGVWSQSEKYEGLIKKFTKVPIVLYHSQPLDQAIKITQQCKNVFLETSTLTIDNVIKMIKVVSSHKIIFGSDAPIGFKKTFQPQEYSQTIKKFMNQLAKQDCENIFFNNANKILDFKLK